MRPSAPRNPALAVPCLVALAAALAATLSCIHRGRPPATLGGCTLCHVDIADKHRPSRHYTAAVGCITCHGPSRPHVEDENNEVKPDRTFPRHDIDELCAGCHLDTCRHTQARQRHAPPQTCADCHGAHAARLPARH